MTDWQNNIIANSDRIMDEAARQLAEAGILVVQNRCAAIERRKLARRSAASD